MVSRGWRPWGCVEPAFSPYTRVPVEASWIPESPCGQGSLDSLSLVTGQCCGSMGHHSLGGLCCLTQAAEERP